MGIESTGGGGGGGGSGNGITFLGSAEYAHAGADSSVDPTTSSAVFVDAQAALQVTFIVPNSGAVLVELVGQPNSDAGTFGYWGIADAGGDIVGTSQLVSFSSGLAGEGKLKRRITGLAPGATETFRWRMRNANGGAINHYTGPNYGKLVMTVYGIV